MSQIKWVVASTLLVVVACGWSFAADAENEPIDGAASDAPVADSSATGPMQRSQMSSLTDAELQSEQRIERVLDETLKSPLDFIETPVNTIVTSIAEEYDLPILFDVRALESVAQSSETEVSISVRNVSLRTALEYIFRQLDDVAFIVDREVLLVTSEDEASSRVQTRVYQIDDLLPKAASGRGDAPGQFTPIVEVITRSVDSQSWAANKSGDGEICIVEPGVLVVTQTQSVHAKIARLLATIRRVKAAIPTAQGIPDSKTAEERDPFAHF